jgi:hypothetical protein
MSGIASQVSSGSLPFASAMNRCAGSSAPISDHVA